MVVGALVVIPGNFAASAAAPVVNNIIAASGSHLVLNGNAYQFTGVNAFEIATDWGTNAGCGEMETDAQLDGLFASLPPNSMVRFWAFQGGLATDVNTGHPDWTPIDRVFAAAAAYHQRLIPVITDQGGVCDGGHWQDPSWYEGGFKEVFNDSLNSDGTGHSPLSYWTYLQEIVNRYKDSPALGMWEPISEAEASTCPPQYQPTNCGGHQTCPDESVAAWALRYFFNAVGSEIHALDTEHLVENGLLGGGQCGIANGDYRYVSASPEVDVLSYHDYYPSSPYGSANWAAIDSRISQALSLSKPIIAGEAGILAGPRPGCVSLANRNDDILQKEQALLQAGGSGMLVWDWVPTGAATCSYDVKPADPLLQPGGAVE